MYDDLHSWGLSLCIFKDLSTDLLQTENTDDSCCQAADGISSAQHQTARLQFIWKLHFCRFFSQFKFFFIVGCLTVQIFHDWTQDGDKYFLKHLSWWARGVVRVRVLNGSIPFFPTWSRIWSNSFWDELDCEPELITHHKCWTSIILLWPNGRNNPCSRTPGGKSETRPVDMNGFGITCWVKWVSTYCSSVILSKLDFIHKWRYRKVKREPIKTLSAFLSLSNMCH